MSEAIPKIRPLLVRELDQSNLQRMRRPPQFGDVLLFVNNKDLGPTAQATQVIVLEGAGNLFRGLSTSDGKVWWSWDEFSPLRWREWYIHPDADTVWATYCAAKLLEGSD